MLDLLDPEHNIPGRSKDRLLSHHQPASQTTNGANQMTKLLATQAEPKRGMFFHWCNPAGAIVNQGEITALQKTGYGRAQLFEWVLGEPSTVIKLTPGYLRSCIFYPSAGAMNAAYEAQAAKGRKFI